MDDVTATLVDEVLALQAEVAALRVMAGAAVVDDPVQYISMVVANIDAYTLPMVMSEAQRAVLRERLEYTKDLWLAHVKETHPGGWRGLRYWLGRTVKRIHRVFAGSIEFPQPDAPTVDWAKLANGPGMAPSK